ncbi:MAG TPA: nitroreductase family deazaflavin-dependent oxidoreductase [Acidimicrobiia bacterium]
MAKKYEVNASTIRVGRVMSWMARRGIGRTEILTTTGRRSGEPRRVPVSPIRVDGVEYIVSPYGTVGWVQNVRADPEATLRHGSTERPVRLEAVGGTTGAKAVAAYHAREGYARGYMDVPDDPTLEDFADRLDRFPVFEVTDRV